MMSRLQIITKGGKKEENDNGAEEEAEPVSPTGEYFNSKVLSVCIHAILEFEDPIDVSCVIPQLQHVFLPINTRFSSIMVYDKNTGARQWKRVKVNLEDHVIIPTFPDNLPVESYDHYFDEYLTKLSVEALPQDRPLWELHIFKYPTSKAVGQVIFKLHHALGDGYSLMGALLSCVKRPDNPSLPLTFPSITRACSQLISCSSSSNYNKLLDVMNWVPRTLSAIYKGGSDFGWSFLKSTLIADDKTPIRSENKGLGGHPLKISTIEFSLDQIKVMKTKLGTTVNDIVAGIIFHGIRSYMNATNPETGNSQSTALVLLNTRNVTGYMSVEEMKNAHSKIWGNNFAFLHVAIPELVNDKNSNPLEFVYEAQKQIMRLRTSPAVYITAQCLEFLRKCKGPEAVAELIHSTLNKASLAITNMIGPIERVALADNSIKGMYFIPTGSSQMVISILSYMRTVRIGLGVEKGFIDSQRLSSCIENSFKMVYEETTKSK